ncbi:MAG: hypothetical protein QN174_05750 [Armatimonadota bacterium]|nr:hypothetical protein [Armatimonadota bacterium]MDR7455146.1 hypothetical protein [Armatimonadota bacterium]MDR7455773.1 hypothetical protein [Armatimonadota bacterium]MDR7496443.1 hypothetical protein [Armatimonadota bacterium]MDR7511981.1 hypothetical protein [Armatimonadota bacterium]
MSLSPELRQRIYEEERFRLEARARTYEEIRLRRQRSSLATRLLLMVMVFAASYLASDYYVKRLHAVPEFTGPAQAAGPEVSPAALEEVRETLALPGAAVVCATIAGRGQPQVRGTIELARDPSLVAARRLAMRKAEEVGATLRRHGLALPAYVEIISPARWWGVAVYDRDTLEVAWEPCPGRCELEGTKHVKRCGERRAP